MEKERKDEGTKVHIKQEEKQDAGESITNMSKFSSRFFLIILSQWLKSNPKRAMEIQKNCRIFFQYSITTKTVQQGRVKRGLNQRHV